MALLFNWCPAWQLFSLVSELGHWLNNIWQVNRLCQVSCWDSTVCERLTITVCSVLGPTGGQKPCWSSMQLQQVPPARCSFCSCFTQNSYGCHVWCIQLCSCALQVGADLVSLVNGRVFSLGGGAFICGIGYLGMYGGREVHAVGLQCCIYSPQGVRLPTCRRACY